MLNNSMELKIFLKNCFGIGKLEHSFDLSKDNAIMVYAPNGTMKTSLARTFMCLEDNHNAADLLDDTKVSKYSIQLDGNFVANDQVYVYKTEDNQIEPNGISHIEEDNLGSFISSPKEVAEFKNILEPIGVILRGLDDKFNKFVDYGKIVFHEEVLKLYKENGILAKYDSLYKAIIESKGFDTSKCNFSGVYYKELFDKHGVSAKYINSHYNELISTTTQRKIVKVVGQRRWNRLCKIVDDNSYIRSKIGDLDSLRKEFLLFFIKSENTIISEYFSLYNKIRGQLLNIISKVNKDTQLWDLIISIFNNRFHVPYHLQLDNKAEALLNHDFLRIKYLHSNGRGEIEYKSKEHFLNFVSTGEKRAYYLLINLFEIEKRKTRKKKQIIVIDDIAESFDYKNKYAIIEYLADLKDCKNFILIILTHNFDFYRTVHSRLNVKNIFIANKDKERNVTLQKGSYVRDIIKNKLIKNIDNPLYLIALIPFVRNIVEYTKGGSSDEYIQLTSFLHVKPETESLTMGDLMRIVAANIHIANKVSISNTDQKYINCLYCKAEDVVKSDNIIAIENKLVLSMAIRIIAELFMTREIGGKTDENRDVNSNQTKFLFEKYRKCHPAKENESKIIRKVLMLTSENIHINNFMFEPIIDLSLDELKYLYNEVKSLQ